jgi:Flp pilus assembly protein CpaB
MKRQRSLFAVSLVVVFCGGILLGFLAGQRAVEKPAPIAWVDVVIAAQPIERGTVIGPEMLTTIPIPETCVTEAMIWSLDDVTGSIARFDIEAGTPVTRSMIAIFAP